MSRTDLSELIVDVMSDPARTFTERQVADRLNVSTDTVGRLRRATVPDPASGMPPLTGWVIVGRKHQLPAAVLAAYIAHLPVVA